jgi:membrane protein implicated in regulation of membrane protease activity
MHHVLLFLPLVALILFFYYPWRTAVPVYLVILVGSLLIYWKALQAQRRPPATGTKAMVGGQALVVRVEDDLAEVEYEGEIWRAASSEPLQVGQAVIIQDVKGLTLRVIPREHDRKN